MCRSLALFRAFLRSIFVGPPEAGKSSLKHLLVHNTPKAVNTSTAVMDTPEVVRSEQYTVGESTSAWQLVDSDVMKKALHTCIASQAYEEKDSILLKWKPKRLKMGSMKLLWRSKWMPVLSQNHCKLGKTSMTLPYSMSSIPDCFKKWEGKGNKLN